MSWFDSITNLFGGHEAAKAPAAAPAAPAAAAPAAAAPESKGWGDSHWAKATGLSNWAELFGVGKGKSDPAAAAGGGGSAAPATASSTPAASADPSKFQSNQVTGKKDSNGFQKDDKNGGYKLPSYQNWGATGKSYGKGEADDKATEGGKGMQVTGPPATYQPDLSKIPTTKTGIGSKETPTGAGSFHESAYGSYSGWTGLAAQEKNEKTGEMESSPESKWKINAANGKGGIDVGVGYQGQWGASEKGGWRAAGASKSGQSTASAEAGYVAQGGASGDISLNTKEGLQAKGGVGGKVGLYGSADANAKTGDVTVGGVKYNAGAGAHADAFVGAKAGASGQIGFGPEFIGAKGDIGAFAGAEAQGDVHANLGPVGGKVGGSVMAGAGIGADGDISYKDGKFHVGGKMFAALGYGGSLSGDVTIDVGSIGRTVGNAGSAAYHEAGHLASEAGTAISNTASSAYNTASNAVHDVMSW